MPQSNLPVQVGTKVSVAKTVTEQDVADFARLSGDHNPVHLDAKYAAQTRFKQRVVHGAFSLALISAALGTKVAGPKGTVVYLGQSCRFLKPVFLGDTVTATCEVTQIKADRPLLTFACKCANQKGEEVLTGESTILLDPFPFSA